MYKSYKDSLSKGNNTNIISKEVKEKLERSWKTIDQQCEGFTKTKYAFKSIPAHSTNTLWKPVRIFVSSTFSDFFNEREALVKKVFPALREWCEDRKLFLIECDLRWGVPKDTSTGDTICACLEELDRCYLDNKCQPFFLCLMGERYGWIPDMSDIPEDVRDTYDWVPDTSITSMEILHGAYRAKSSNAAFFMRDERFLKDVPEKHVKSFIDDDELQSEQLKVLKEKIQVTFPEQIFDYECHVTGVDDFSGSEKVILGGLDDFCEKVLKFFKMSIERMYPKPTEETELTYAELKKQTHLAFIEQKADGIVGRNEELEKILRFATNGELDSSFQKIKGFTEEKVNDYMKSWEVSEADNPILCMVSPPGYGKTSLLACAVIEAAQRGIPVFYHFVGSDPRSNMPHDCIFRLISQLAEDPEEIEKLKFVSEPDQRPTLIKLLSRSREASRQLLIVIDGLDQMIDNDKIYSTAWLPCRFPSNIRCVVSTNNHNLILDRLGVRGALRWEFGPVTMETQHLIVNNYLGRYSKKLDSEQMTNLLSHNGSVLPQWLALACEELRIFGNFRGVTSMTENFPDEIQDLIRVILDRKVTEDQTKCLVKILCLIHSSMAGIAEEDIPMLLGSKNEPVPMVTWAVLRIAIKPFIQTTTAGGDTYVSSRISFSSKLVKEVVGTYYIKTEQEACEWHGYLADYYQYQCRRTSVCADELPYQLIKARCNKRLIDFLRQDGRALRINDFFKRKYVESITCKKPAMVTPMTKPLILCNLCNRKIGLYKKGQKASETCMHCGLWMAMTYRRKAAQTCMQHTRIHGRPGAEVCYECATVVSGFNAPSHQVSLCTWCWKMNSCCAFLT